MGWEHDALAADLAGYLNGPEHMVWTDMQLGPSGSPRPDVYTIRRSYSKPQPMAYEIKISRSDLRSDTTSGKWQKYLKYAQGVVFAVPEGLCTVADIPDTCGLIVRKAEVWRYARRPTLQAVSLPMDACMKLLIDGVHRTYDQADPKPRKVDTWRVHEGVRQKFGEAVALAARDLLAIQERISRAAEVEAYEREQVRTRNEAYKKELARQAEAEAGQWMQLRTEIMDFFGIETAGSLFSCRRRLNEMRKECDADARVEAAEETLRIARRNVEHALSTISQGIPAPLACPASILPDPSAANPPCRAGGSGLSDHVAAHEGSPTSQVQQ